MSISTIFDSIIDLLIKSENKLLSIEVFEKIRPITDLFDIDEKLAYEEWSIRYLKKQSSYLPTNVEKQVNFIAESMLLSNYTEEIDVEEQLNWLEKVGKAHHQRTPEWYSFRKKVITASSLGKIFESENSNYAFLKEKVLPEKNFTSSKATEFGKRFEDTAQRVYEDITQTKVSEYGCIPHKSIGHLGASPDGIVTETYKYSYLLGRMLEIKCLYSRSLIGIPKYIYWVQCQIQLEVCDLEYCDFFECNLKEFNTLNELLNYVDLKNITYYGILIELYDKDQIKIKELKSNIKNTKQSITKWYDKNVDYALESDYSIVFKCWAIEKYSRMTIQRNREWFDSVKDQINNFWDNVMTTRTKFDIDPLYFEKHEKELREKKDEKKKEKSKIDKNNVEFKQDKSSLEKKEKIKTKKMTKDITSDFSICMIDDDSD